MGIYDLVGGLFGGETSVNIPGQSANQSRLEQLQADQIEKQNMLINALMPSMLESAGLQPIFDSSGKMTSVEKLNTPEANRTRAAQAKFMDLSLSQLEGMTANAPQQQEIQKLLNDRTLAALKGELPEDPALVRQLGEQEQLTKETLRKNLGPGWETSEPAIRAMASFMGRKNEALMASRRGDLNLATGLGGQNLSSIGAQANGGVDISERLRGTRLGEMFNMPQSFSAGLGNINPFLNNQNAFRLGAGQMNLQSDTFNSMMNMQQYDRLADFLGTSSSNGGIAKTIGSLFGGG